MKGGLRIMKLRGVIEKTKGCKKYEKKVNIAHY